jgi:hypothetical protein
MTTKLDGELRRELLIGGHPYTLTLSQAGLTLALKGRRKGLDIAWSDLVNGDAALATALNASLRANILPENASPKHSGSGRITIEPQPHRAGLRTKRGESATKPRG